MATITKKELIDRIAESAGSRRVLVKKVVQQFLDEIVNELGKGNRLEFRDFGVFESKLRKARKAQNPKTLEPVAVPEKRTVKFKVGRLMKQRLSDLTGTPVDDEAGDVAEMTAVRISFRGTHRGDGLGIPPTGRTVNVTGIILIRWRDGTAVEGWNEFDAAGMLKQLSAPAATAAKLRA